MIKKSLSFMIAVLILFMFCSCKEEVKHKTGWQNPEEPATGETTTITEEESTIKTPDISASATEKPEISFSEKTALKCGDFNSPIYGKLTLYFQDEHFLVLDEYGDQRFTVFAQGYSPSKTDGEPQAIFDDMDFDGAEDFGVCYYKDALNSYYFCFLWNSAQKTFTYYLPLSNLANPEFDFDKKTIIANERLTVEKTLEKLYHYNAGSLTMISSKEVTKEAETEGAETVDANMQINPRGYSSSIILKANENSHSRWECIIENEGIAVVESYSYNEESASYEFTLTGISPGTTTVIFRYVSVHNGEYIEEIVVNAQTNPDLTINIIVPE